MKSAKSEQTSNSGARPSAHDPEAQPRAGATRDWWLLAVAALLPLFVTEALWKSDIPLGKVGTLVYQYSPAEIMPRRLAALPPAVGIAAALGVGVWLLFSPEARRRQVGWLLTIAGYALGVGWTFVSPPDFRSQHLFNMQSPSHDGAFLTEAYEVRRMDMRAYLHAFPRRALAPPQEMRGTRVISNPPGTTLIAAGTIELLNRSPRLARWARTAFAEEGLPPPSAKLVATALGFSLVLLLLWALAGLPLFWCARLFFSARVAAVLAIVCLFSPATLLFAPGKDPAQLLTTAVPLWLWLLAWRREKSWAALLAGGVFILACLVSLVHIWIAAIVLAASALATPAGRRARFGVRTVVPAVGGALLLIGCLAVFADLNFVAMAWSVTRSQAEVTRGVGAMPLIWQAVGLPLFLLFAGPALWCLTLWLPRGRPRDAEGRFGLFLMLGSAAVMLLTIGFTNMETPRLWIPFTPLLLLGAALQLRMFRQPGRNAARLLATLVFVQFAASAAQWSLMDMREAETRLLQRGEEAPRFFE